MEKSSPKKGRILVKVFSVGAILVVLGCVGYFFEQDKINLWTRDIKKKVIVKTSKRR